MRRVIILAAMLSIVFSSISIQETLGGVKIKAVAGGVFVGIQQVKILSLPSLDPAGVIDPTMIQLQSDKRVSWSTGVTAGVVFWPSLLYSEHDENGDDQDGFGVGFGVHVVTVVSDDIEKLAPAFAFHFGSIGGVQAYIGWHFMHSDRVQFSNGENTMNVPVNTDTDRFLLSDAGSAGNVGNIIIGISTGL